MDSTQVLMGMTIALFTLGAIAFVTGGVILAVRASGREIKTMTAETTRLAQKGIAEDVAGLVGNASSLLDALNQLTRTAAGVGAFLMLLGLFMMGAACYVTIAFIGSNPLTGFIGPAVSVTP